MLTISEDCEVQTIPKMACSSANSPTIHTSVEMQPKLGGYCARRQQGIAPNIVIGIPTILSGKEEVQLAPSLIPSKGTGQGYGRAADL